MKTAKDTFYSNQLREHRMPFGTRILPQGGVLFRLWAPSAEKVELCIETGAGDRQIHPMLSTGNGWYQNTISTAAPGQNYSYRIGSDLLVPDPVSRSQLDDIHGPSLIIDPNSFIWQDSDWRGRPWEEAIIYEIHTGTFSAAGNFNGIRERLPYLAELGITAIELMPIADFPGKFNWGYDGALLFAPDRSYGSCRELKELVQDAHKYGLMVILDVVYNHFGPEGNYLYVYAKEAFFTPEHHTPWGDAIRYDGTASRTVRDFFIHNALYWLEEYHFDGLRLDAVHAIYDGSNPNILEEIATAVRGGPGRDRHIHLILENDKNESKYLTQKKGQPLQYNAQWNDDLHHACHVLLTAERSGYYTDYADNPIYHLGRCLTEGFSYQGDISKYRDNRCRGQASAHLSPVAFISFLQNHDQIGNRAFGERLNTIAPKSLLRLAISLILLSPSPPLLFMGEEFGCRTPFFYFCDFSADLAEKVTVGRRMEFSRFPEFSDNATLGTIPDPSAPQTFNQSCIAWEELQAESGTHFYSLYSHLISIRRRHIIPMLAGLQEVKAHFHILSPLSLQAHWQLNQETRLHVAINFSPENIHYKEPLAGRLLFHEEAIKSKSLTIKHTLPPHSVAWFLES